MFTYEFRPDCPLGLSHYFMLDAAGRRMAFERKFIHSIREYPYLQLSPEAVHWLQDNVGETAVPNMDWAWRDQPFPYWSVCLRTEDAAMLFRLTWN